MLKRNSRPLPQVNGKRTGYMATSHANLVSRRGLAIGEQRECHDVLS